MCLRFVFLLITRLAAGLRLSRREETWKTAEILILRHQLAVATAPAGPAEAELGGPGPAHGPAQPDTESTPPRVAAAGHPGHDAALAPRHRPPALGCQVHARQDRPPGHPPEHQGPSPPAGPGKSRLGVPQDPRRAGRPGGQDRSVDRLGDPQGQRHRPRPAPDPADLATILALPGRRDPGERLLHGRPARRHPGLRPGRDRARQQSHPHPWRHPVSHRGMDHAAGPQPPHGPRRTSTPGSSS
jgi:hypothetical protein